MKPLKTDLADFVKDVIHDPATGFAETISVNGGDIAAIVVQNFDEETVGDFEIVSTLTAVTVPTADLVADTAEGDLVVIGADNYTIKERRDRNSGTTRLVLFNAP